MSDRATEDEIMDETRRFGQALAAAAHRHAVATTWLEKRLARKQVSRLMRGQHRDEQHTRAQHRKFTTNAVDWYRQHSLAVAERAADPRTGVQQRERDMAALARHRVELQHRILTDPHLSETQRGIALDGVEAVTEFPRFKLGNLYAPGRRVVGMDALRYRAHVARVRTELGIDRFQRGATQRGTAQQRAELISAASGGAALRPRPEQGRAEATPQPPQPVQGSKAEQAPVAPGPQRLSLAQTEWVHKLRAAQLNWDAKAPAARDRLALQVLDDQRQFAARNGALAGLSPERISYELEHAQANSRFTSSVSSSSEQGSYTDRGFHATEQEAAEWTQRVVTETDWNAGVSLRVAVRERGNATPLRQAEGSPDRIRARISRWTRNPERAQQQASGGADNALAELRNRHRFSIEHNADLAEQNARLTRQLTAVTADRDQLAAAVADRTTPQRPAGTRDARVQENLASIRDNVNGLRTDRQARRERNAESDRERVAAIRRNAATAQPQTAEAARVREWALSATDAELLRGYRAEGRDGKPGTVLGETVHKAGEQESAARDRIADDAAYRPSNGQLDQELAELRADRDRLRGERDEAVAKLAERTPPEQRFGSAERQAQAARETDREPDGDGQPGTPVKKSALAAHRGRNALIRNGAERDGFDR
jgi:hypothetical protein